MRVSHGFVHANGLRLHFLDSGGSGTPIVCLHGVTGHVWVWNAVAERLTRLGRGRRARLPGFGDSQWSAEAECRTDDHLPTSARSSPPSARSRSISSARREVGWSRSRTRPPIRVASGTWPWSTSHRRRTQAEDDVPPMAYDFADHAEVVAAERAANPPGSFRLRIRAAFGCPRQLHGTPRQQHRVRRRRPHRHGGNHQPRRDEWRRPGVVNEGQVIEFLELPIGGIVADLEPEEMARREELLEVAARHLGCSLRWPFMYMFFLPITAIPE